jgi:hypothetical protein
MGDIPGLDYEPPVHIDRAALPNHDAVPELHRSEFDGRVRESLWWEYIEQGEEVRRSKAPAHMVAFSGTDDRELASETGLTRLWEGLELPGEPSDYHFAIQGRAEALWSRYRQEPEMLEWFEYLNWLDLRLIQAVPDAVRDEYAGDQPERSEFYRVSAFSNLISLYLREGFLQAAQGVAELAKRFGQSEHAIAELNERVAALRAEDGD